MTASERVTLSAGKSVGQYDVLGPLGAGGMGEVYRARDRRLGRVVALKVLSPGASGDAQRLGRLAREARIVSALSHPHIVAVYEVGESEGSPFIAMELIEGQSLRQMLRSGGMPVRKLLQIGTQIAEGLARAHEAGVVHRDLKPDNVMVTPDGNVKILDFGLAKLTRSFLERGAGPEDGTLPLPTEPGVLLGTVRYMSPEQASGRVADFHSDQFALGAVLYEMATGQAAFQRETTVDTLSAILHEEPASIAQRSPAVPAPLRWLIERCLAKDPADRFAATADLARDLAGLRDHLSDLSSLPALAETPARRRRWLPPAAFALVAVAAYVAGARRAPVSRPQFRQLTTQSAGIASARFTPDGQTVVYSAQWEGKRPEIFETRIDHVQPRSLGLPSGYVLSVSTAGFVAVSMLSPQGMTLRPPSTNSVERNPAFLLGTLAQVPLLGGAPRELVEGVFFADWAPNGKDLAVSRLVGGRYRLEYPAGKTLFESAGQIAFPRVSLDGKHVSFADQGANLMMADVSGRVVDTGVSAWEQAWSPAGELWYFSGTGPTSSGNELRAHSPAGKDRLVTTLPGEFTIYDIASSGAALLGQITESEEIFVSRAGETDRIAFPGAALWDVSESADVVTYADDSSAFLARTDGSPPKRLDALGGFARALLSPDGRAVLGTMSQDGLAVLDAERSALVLVPTAAGSPRVIATRGLSNPVPLALSRRGDRVYLFGVEAGHGRRVWEQEIETGRRRAISPEGVGRGALTPDERLLVAVDLKGDWNLYPTEGGEPTRVAGLRPGEEPIQWTSDSRLIYVRGADEVVAGGKAIPARVYRLDPWTGRREIWKEIPPITPLTGGGIGTIRFSADGQTCFYNHLRYSSELFLVTGLR